MANKNTIQVWRFESLPKRKFRNDLAGSQVESLWIIGIAGKHGGEVHWLCECECGEFIFVATSQLIRTDWRRTRSCGCRNRQPKTHGYARTKVYRTWGYIKDRCLNPNNQDYANYGGAGITMYEGWVNNFEAFLAHVGEPPTPRHSIDRWPNKFGNYEPNNVRWATPTQQARNARTNKMITFNSETHCLSEWAELIGVDQDTLSWRLLHGWSVERALTTPTMA